jgi:hypothetical protein
MNAAFYQGLEVRYLKCLHQYKGKYKSEGKKIKYIIPYSLYNIIPKRSNLTSKELHQYTNYLLISCHCALEQLQN